MAETDEFINDPNELRGIRKYIPFLSLGGFAAGTANAVREIVENRRIYCENELLRDAIKCLNDQIANYIAEILGMENDVRSYLGRLSAKHYALFPDGGIMNLEYKAKEFVGGTLPNGTMVDMFVTTGEYGLREGIRTVPVETLEINSIKYGMARYIPGMIEDVEAQITPIKDAIDSNFNLMHINSNEMLSSVIGGAMSLLIGGLLMYATNPENFKQIIREEVPNDFSKMKNHLKSLYSV